MNLLEKLNKYDYIELMKNSGFGLELEVEIENEALDLFLLKEKISLFELIEKLYKLRQTNQKEFFNELDKVNKINNEFKTSFIFLIKELEKYGPIHIGEKGSGSKVEGWKIEKDESLLNGVEFITPSNNNKGLSHTEVLKTVPRVTELLLKLGLHGQDSTGLHIHISYKDKLNKDNYLNYLDTITKKYSLFSIISYLSTRESDNFFAQGDINRKSKSYSKTFDNDINIIQAYTTLFINFCIDQLTDKIPNNKNIVISIPVLEFIKPNSLYLKNSSMDKQAKNYLDSITNSNKKSNDLAIRESTIELRGLGNKEAIEKMSDTMSCSKILKMALTQLNELAKDKEPELKDILKATKYILDKSLIPAINGQIFFTYYDLKQNKLTKEEKINGLTLIPTNLEKTNNISKALLNNKLLGFESSYNKDITLLQVNSEYKVISKY